MNLQIAELEFLKKFEKALNEQCAFYSDDANAVLVALSGGPDSVALLKAAMKLIGKEKVYAVHINHMLRGNEADRDQQYCKNLCEQLGIEFFTYNVDVKELANKTSNSIEMAARILRYNKLHQVADEIKQHNNYKNVYIAVGHNMNDQAETVLLNIGRGTALKGLCGMDYLNSKEAIIRPMLDITRQEIECYAQDLLPVTDATNLECEYTRNKLRIEAIPLLSNVFKRDFVKMVTDMANSLKHDNAFLEKYSWKAFSEYYDFEEKTLSIEFMYDEDIAIAYRIIRYAIENVKGDLLNVSNQHIQDIYEICKNKKSSKKVHLPNGMYVEYKYSRVFFFNEISDEKNDVSSIDDFLQHLSYEVLDKQQFTYKDVKSFKRNDKHIFFDLDKLLKLGNKDEMCFRFRLPGDIIKTYKGNGNKKLKKYFIDEKIDCNLRNNIPLFVVNNNVIWIVGYTVDDNYLASSDSERILELKFD